MGVQMLVSVEKSIETDRRFNCDESNSKYSNYVFNRLVAKRIKFTNVDFKYTFFENCYLRNCTFDSCDFTGCRFTNTQLPNVTFLGCRFDYATFDKTLIGSEVLDTGCPGHDNLKLRFARSLRTNFQQLGDAEAANKAMLVELSATESHLKKAWRSNESYYRSHHPGAIYRTIAFLKWTKFRILDFIWGNGESPLRLARFVLVVLMLMAFADLVMAGDPINPLNYPASFVKSVAIFFGTLAPESYDKTYLAAITFIRFVTIGFFLSIIIKRFSRR